MTDSGDCSDAEMNQPSCSRKTVQNNIRGKRNRRLVMRFEFKDSDDTDADETHSVSNNDNSSTASFHGSVGIDLRGSSQDEHVKTTVCSGLKNSGQQRKRQSYLKRPLSDNDIDSNSEVDEHVCMKRKQGQRRQKLSLSDSEDKNEKAKNINADSQGDLDVGFSSDSSSNEFLEKCPICLISFRQQEIGRPSTCEHIFCATCIEAWANNVQTCPIDRLTFDKIIVLNSCKLRNIVREIRVDLNKSKRELVLDEEDNDGGSVINEHNDLTNCEICNSPDREEIMLLCDSCNQGYHMDCLDPPLFEIPTGSWYCDNCIDSDDEAEDEDLELAEDLHTLYEDIREMGLPETRLRIRQVRQPRILRTRQNERIRAAVLRDIQPRSWRQSLARAQLEDTTTQASRRNRNTTTTRSNRVKPAKHKPKKQRRRCQRSRHRTYVVEYDLNNFDEKFALKTGKKVIRRRRKNKLALQTKSRNRSKVGATTTRMSASKRLAEQLGVKIDGGGRSYLNGGGTSSFTLFGNPNDLDYFSDTEEIREGIGGAVLNEQFGTTAVQSLSCISNVGPLRNRKSLLAGKSRMTAPIRNSGYAENSDILSNILELQDLWLNASRNLGEIHINSDGSLDLTKRTEVNIAKPTTATVAISSTEHITEIPLYQRGGAAPNLNQGSAGNYNNRYSSNSSRSSGGSNTSGSRAAEQYQHHSTGSMSNDNDHFSTESSPGNQNFNNNPNGNSNGPLPNTNFTPFNIRLNSTNQQQRNQSIQETRQPTCSSGIRAPKMATVPATTNCSHIIPQEERQLFSGLPAPINVSAIGARMSMPPVLTIPPPPAPPSLSWNSSLFKINAEYTKQTNQKGEEEEDNENCPNFSIYSQESQAVATELFTQPLKPPTNIDQDDDKMNEDLVQLDDDEDIPLPPERPAETVAIIEDLNKGKDLYEPENPTEELILEENDVMKKPSLSDSTDTCNEINQSNVKDAIPEEMKIHCTPSPSTKDARSTDTGKGVLELYDDSDWEELEIDRPKDFEKAIKKDTPVVEKYKASIEDVSVKSLSNDSDQDRSYTPCLDEKNIEDDTLTLNRNENNEKFSQTKKSERTADNTENIDDRIAVLCTELISEDEELPNEHDFKRRSRSRSRNRIDSEGKSNKSKRNTKRGKTTTETFKKVGNRQKDRNYRGDRQSQRDITQPHRSHSKLPRTISRSCSNQSLHHSRSRSLSRSIRNRRHYTRSKSYSRSRSSSNSPSGSRVHTYKSRGVGRGRGGQRLSYRNQDKQYQHHHQQTQYQQQFQPHQLQFQTHNQYQVQAHVQRPKRRELPRYDVRNIVSASRFPQKDRYGRDASRSARSRSVSYERRCCSRTSTKSRSRSGSPKRFRSFSISPSPSVSVARHKHNQNICRRSISVSRKRFNNSASVLQQLQESHRNSPLQRSNSTVSVRSRSNTPGRINGNRSKQRKKESPCHSPRYTPRLSRCRSKSPKKKKKKKTDKKKKAKKRATSNSPVTRQRRLSRQRDPFDDADDFLAPQLSKKSKKTETGLLAGHWSPSPTPSPSTERLNFIQGSATGISGEKFKSWTPPLASSQASVAHYNESPHRSLTPIMIKKIKTKREKSKKRKKTIEKQRKDKKRKRRTMTPEPLPSKEVFASGNNILVSVSFNKDASNSVLLSSAQQQTVVSLPPTRDDFVGGGASSIDRLTSNIGVTSKKSKRKRKKVDAKPVAIIDLERSPFQVHQEPADVIVLTDSEDANDNQLLLRHERRLNSIASVEMTGEDVECEKSPPTCSEANLDTSFDNIPQTTGPKTPPEPHLVKFNLPAKKQHKVRTNPLQDENEDIHSADELETVCSIRGTLNEEQQKTHIIENLTTVQKIGPNTPPESGPCSPDVYDPFEPTKSPSLSPCSPTPNPAQNLEPITLQSPNCVSNTCTGVEKIETGIQNHKTHNDDVDAPKIGPSILLSSNISTTQGNTNININPVDLVMALMNKPSNNIQQDLPSKPCDISTKSITLPVPSTEEKLTDNSITVLSNVLLTNSTVVSASQHIPVISSPQTTLVRKLGTLPKAGSSVASSNSGIVNLPAGSGTKRNGSTAHANVQDDSLNMDIESPYSPGSADYEDLFEPPCEGGNVTGSNRRSKSSTLPSTAKKEMFDNLFGSTSPVSQHRTSARYNYPGGRKQQRANSKSDRKSKLKGNKSVDDNVKQYDDVPNSAVDLHVKDKFIRKLNRQERVVEEVKLVLKPHFNKKIISKDDYKDIMRRAVPKICHSRSGEINPHKIKNLIDAYVKKFRAKHKKLNLFNTGQVSSAVKCAAYLKKL